MKKWLPFLLLPFLLLLSACSHTPPQTLGSVAEMEPALFTGQVTSTQTTSTQTTSAQTTSAQTTSAQTTNKKNTPAMKKPAISPENLIKRYEAILDIEKDPEVILKVQRRIADLKMIASENRQYNTANDNSSDTSNDNSNKSTESLAEQGYRDVINHYTKLLQEHPLDAQNEQLLYQLAKAYDFEADTKKSFQTLTKLVKDFPNSAYYYEAQYRRADIYYSQKRYQAAQDTYQLVLNGGKVTPYYTNSLYMRGWSQFKRNQYQEASTTFSQLLDDTLGNKQPDNIAKESQALVNDTLRILCVIFSYQEYGDSIAALYKTIGHRAYEPVLYEHLANLLIERQLHKNAIATYARFIEEYPYHLKAPEFQVNIIETNEKAQYSADYYRAKETFISHYGFNSEYWQQANNRDYIRDHLHTYLHDMSNYHHAYAQALKAKNGSNSDIKEHFSAAIIYYEQWIALFQDDEKTPEKAFLLGEAYYESGDPLKAIQWYEYSAYEYAPHSRSEEAGYAAVLTQQFLLGQIKDQDSKEWVERAKAKIASQIRYVSKFSDNSKALPLVINTANTQMVLKNYEYAIKQCEKAFHLKSTPDIEQQKLLYLIQANSYYALENFASSEINYSKARDLNLPNSKTYNELTENIATTIYKQADLAVKDNKLDDAVNHFDRLLLTTPTSSMAVNAHFDKISYLLTLKKWQEALSALNQFKMHYPKHELAVGLEPKYILAYEGLQDWNNAAVYTLELWRNTKDPEQKRQALFLAAEDYEKANNIDKSLETFQLYVKNYPTPYDLALETQHKISEIYLKKNDIPQYHYWLNQMILAEQKNSTERSRYLAAAATKVFAELATNDFNAIKLKVPLQQSLKVKQKAFMTAIDWYKKMDDYRAAEFSSYANYKIAEIYKTLSKDLLESEKPTNLNELELEQYTILLEEQAFPFEETAIQAYEKDTTLSWQGVYDEWVQKSFSALKELMPARYNKPEKIVVNYDRIY